ncbi:MAG: nickel pincer cofactor biosynthesis protein LarB [Pseudomonadota bacterium]
MSDREFVLDYERNQRLGFGEAIFCAQKTPDQITAILGDASERKASMLLTRLEPAKFEKLPEGTRSALDYDVRSQTAFLNPPERNAELTAPVAIVTAGTSDALPAYEAQRTLEFNQVASAIYFDVGVAGLWRLLDRIDDIRQHQVLIAVAGMDAALPSVLGGLFAGPIFAVPTSTGYGAARGGETAVAACLTSCAPGVTVCNIDNGYGAACAALRVLQQFNHK